MTTSDQEAKRETSMEGVGTKLAIGVALVVAVGIGVVVGRSTKEAPVSAPARSQPMVASAAPSESAAPPMMFDLQEDPRFKAGVPIRPMDRDIFNAILSGKITRDQVNDLFPDRPYRVKLIGSPSEQRFGAALIDLNRDGKFEERWMFKPGTVERTVQADEAAGGEPVMYSLAHGRWQVH